MMMLVSGQRETVRLAAAGDIHCSEENRDQVAAGFEEIRGRADLVLLAGDLTTYGEPGEAAVLADIVRGLELPVYVVLGNHDWHADRADEVTATRSARRDCGDEGLHWRLPRLRAPGLR